MNQRTKYKALLFFIISFALNLILIIPQISFAVWERVSTNGFDNKYNVEVTSMAIFNGYLYVGTNKFSIVPPGKILGTGDFGCEVWRSSDGITWEQVNEEGFGDDDNDKACSMTVFDGYLYVGTSNWSTGCEVLRSSDGKEWTQVNSDGFGDKINYDAGSMIVFGNYLYVGTSEGVWRSSNGTMWTKAAYEVSADSMAVFNDYLYARDGYNESSIWRSSKGTSWTKVFYLSWDVSKKMIRTMTVFDGYLYFIADHLEYGTEIWDYGTEIWRSLDGTNWEKVNEDVFGNDVLYNVAPMVVFNGYLYLGTGNSQTGSGVWRSTDGITWEKVSRYRFGNIGIHATSMAVFGSYLYVGTIAGNGCEIWRFDGNPEQRCLAKNIYGEHSEQAEILRQFRDNVIRKIPLGQEIVKLYYQWSPMIVKAMEEDEGFKAELKEMIDGILPLINIQVD